MPTLAVRNRVSRRDTVELLGELFACRLATGTIDTILRRAGEALEEPHAQLHTHVRSAPAVNINETGWRTAGKRRTLWGALTPQAALFRIAPDRHEREAKALLGEDFEGIACSDRWWAYNYLEPGGRQVCWAHLLRDFTAQSEGLEPEKSFGQARLEIAARLFSAWDDFQGDGDRARLRERVTPLQAELKPHLQRCAGKAPKYKRSRGLARNLLKVWPALWTFTLVEGIEPTNNHAERGLRGGGHLPQTLPRQPIRARRAHHRAAPLGLGHLPPAATLALRLPHRRPQRQHPRRPHSCARLSQRGPERLLETCDLQDSCSWSLVSSSAREASPCERPPRGTHAWSAGRTSWSTTS